MDRKGTQMFLSFLRGMEVVSKCQAMNRRVVHKLMRKNALLMQPVASQQARNVHACRGSSCMQKQNKPTKKYIYCEDCIMKEVPHHMHNA